MLEVAADVLWAEGGSTWLLEDNRDDIVANVSFPKKLLAVIWGEGEER